MKNSPSYVVFGLGLVGLASVVFQGIMYSQTRTMGDRLSEKCTLTADGAFVSPAAAEWYDLARAIQPIILLALALSVIFSVVLVVKSFMDSLNGCLEEGFGRFMQCIMILFPHLLIVLAAGAIVNAPFDFFRTIINPDDPAGTPGVLDEDCAAVKTDMLLTTSWVTVSVATVYAVGYLGYDMSSSKTKSTKPVEQAQPMYNQPMYNQQEHTQQPLLHQEYHEHATYHSDARQRAQRC
jgi:hypothetical protein